MLKWPNKISLDSSYFWTEKKKKIQKKPEGDATIATCRGFLHGDDLGSEQIGLQK